MTAVDRCFQSKAQNRPSTPPRSNLKENSEIVLRAGERKRLGDSNYFIEEVFEAFRGTTQKFLLIRISCRYLIESIVLQPISR